MTESRPKRWDIREVLDRTDLAALLDEHTESSSWGHRRRWHCPVPEHPDTHASVTIHTDARGHERWRCWSGDNGHRGDAIDLVMITRRMGRAEAVELLAQRAGLHPDGPLPAPKPRKAAARPATAVPLDPAVVSYVEACAKQLWTPDLLAARKWLASRGFTKEILQANLVGADPGPHRLARAPGLPKGRGLAVTFPALDPAGNVRYVQTRYLQPGDGPKYMNPAASLGHNPRLAWTTTTTAVDSNLLIVCEGLPDALTAAQHDHRAVAVLGAQAPDDKVATRLATAAEHDGLAITAVIDADDAGRNWAQRLGELLSNTGVDLRIVEPPEEGLDLNAWALQDPGWTRWLDTGEPAVPYERNRDIALEVPTP